MCILIFTRINMIITTQLFVFFTVFGCIVYAAETPYKACNPDDPIYKNIEMLSSHCNSTPCPFKRGSNVTLSASFIPEETHSKMYTIMYFDLNGVKVNYEVEHRVNVCNHIFSHPDKVKVGCPIQKGKRYIFERTVYVLPNVPKLPKVVVHWAIRDHDTKKDIVCYDILVKIV
ncbi:putative protein heh-1 [Planococcus citri]|uniref:putative protein heh-1 n=1 Tax=Planococcus citri TaxID=170843 RepID=UPI0031FA324A